MIFIDKLNFYTVNDEYIEYLYQFDKRVPYNKNSKRPYIGVVLKFKDINYFAPLFSPKINHPKYSDNPTYMRIGTDYGIVRFNNMIPVPINELKYLNINNVKDEKYRMLLISQNHFIKLHSEKILKKAIKLYTWVTVDNKDFFVNLSCNFKLLEEKSKLYKSNLL